MPGRVDVFDVRNGVYARLDAFERALHRMAAERGFDRLTT
jgi:hypothetical protein